MSDQKCFAVLDAGLAHGDTDADDALEQFLRAAEPPAHDRWTHETDRVRGVYPRGAQATLTTLFTTLDNTVANLIREPSPDDGEGPRKLAALFPIPALGRGGNPPPPPPAQFQIEQVRAHLENGVWKVTGRARASRLEEAKPWRVELRLGLDSDGGEVTPLRVAAASIPGLEPHHEDGVWVWNVPSDRREVRFTATTEPVTSGTEPGIDLDLLRRTRLKADIRAMEDCN